MIYLTPKVPMIFFASLALGILATMPQVSANQNEQRSQAGSPDATIWKLRSGDCPSPAEISGIQSDLEKQSRSRDTDAIVAAQLLSRAHRCNLRFDEAITTLLRARGRALALMRRAQENAKVHAVETVLSLEIEVAETYRTAARPKSALAPLETARLLIIEHLDGDLARLADIDFRIGLSALDAGDIDGADTAFARAAKASAEQPAAKSLLTPRIALNRAKVAFERGDPTSAAGFAQESRIAASQLKEALSATTLDAEIQLARAAIEALDYGAAHERLDRVLLGLNARGLQNEQVYADAHYFLGEIELMRGCYAASERFTRRSLTLYGKIRRQDDPVFTRGLHRLGIVCERLDDPAAALKAFDEALARRAANGKAKSWQTPHRCAVSKRTCNAPAPLPELDDPRAARTLLESTLALGKCGYHQIAIERAELAVALLETDPETTDHARALAQAAKGAALFRADRMSDAKPVLELAVAMLAEEAGGDHEDMPPSLVLLAEIALQNAEKGSDTKALQAKAWSLASRAHRILTARQAAPSQLEAAREVLTRLDAPVEPARNRSHCAEYPSQ